jgi:hypothetical protein
VQPTLFDLPHTRHRRTDPETSRTAAATQQNSPLEGDILEVFRLHRPYAGLTDDQLCRLMPERYGPTVKTARSRLTKRGLLVDSGRRAPSGRGREMIVWRKA